MNGANVESGVGVVDDETMTVQLLAAELSAVRKAARIVERIHALETPWPAAMHLDTALEALRSAERIIEHPES